MMKRELRHVAFVINNFSHGAGTEKVTCMIANGLSDMGYKVTIISCREGRECKFPLNSEVNVISLKGEKKKNPLLRKLSIVMMLKDIVYRHKIHYVVAVDVILIYYLLGIKFFNRRVKTIAWEHFNYFAKANISRRIARYLSAWYADAVIVLGDRDLQNYSQHIKGIKNIVRIFNPVTTKSQMKSELKEKTVLAVGRLTRQKGFDYLLEIWKRIEPEFSDWKLCIIGDGEEKNNLETLIEKNNLKQVDLIPFQAEIEKWYLNASIFALTSRYEGFGMVLIEAMVKGLPVVSFACKEGPAELVENNINGFLVEPEDIEGFACKLKKLMSDQKLRENFSSKTSWNLYKFEQGSVLAEWDNLFHSLDHTGE